MAGLFDKQADVYADARPTYPIEWYSKLAALTSHHTLAWDVATGSGQAAIDVAKHYEQVIATDVSESQLERAKPHSRVRYIHTPLTTNDNEIVSLIGGGCENSVDLITVAQAIHWFDLPSFYSLVSRLLRKPGGVIAVWGYNDIVVSSSFDAVLKKFHDTTLPYWDSNIKHIFDGYKTMPFPFEEVGLGREGNPLDLDIPKELSFDGVLNMLKSWSAVITAKSLGVDLLCEEVVEELKSAWGGPNLVRSVCYKAFMIAGKLP
uniref:Methyltransferase type 11 domain-containing protein n=1 Tax=Cannabis sativa TaxID=3483 RepID=A0A803PIN6_CANSA